MEPVANGMAKAMAKPLAIGGQHDCQTSKFDNGSTLTDERTDGRTNERLQDSGEYRPVLNAPPPVDNEVSAPVRWVIRKRFSFMYGSQGMYWRVEHPSLPAYFDHQLHLYSWQDALDYALAHQAIAGAS